MTKCKCKYQPVIVKLLSVIDQKVQITNLLTVQSHFISYKAIPTINCTEIAVENQKTLESSCKNAAPRCLTLQSAR